MEPLNRRIKSYLLNEIQSGNWSENDRIPSEAQLCARFGTSRMTVNRAVRELTEQGYLYRVRGSGTFVSPRAGTATLFQIRSIRAEIEARSRVHGCRVLSLTEGRADAGLARATGFAEGERIFTLSAVHTEDSRPVQSETRHVSADLAPGFISQDFSRITASDYLLETVPYTAAEHGVTAIAASAETAAILDVAEAAPCLCLTRRTWRDDRLVTFVELLHPGDRFRLVGQIPGPATGRGVAT